MTPKSRRVLRVASHLVMWVAVVSLVAHESYRSYRLATHARSAPGTLVSYDPGNHRSAVFQYAIGGATYQASEPVSVSPPRSLTVWYDVDCPQRATIERNSNWQRSLVSAVGFGALFLLLATTLIEAGYRRLAIRTDGG